MQKVVDMFTLADGREVNDMVTLPAQRHLRDVNPDCEPLTNEMSESFHSIVATLLWIMKRLRPDLETAGFLCALGYPRAMRTIGRNSGELSLMQKEP